MGTLFFISDSYEINLKNGLPVSCQLSEESYCVKKLNMKCIIQVVHLVLHPINVYVYINLLSFVYFCSSIYILLGASLRLHLCAVYLFLSSILEWLPFP